MDGLPSCARCAGTLQIESTLLPELRHRGTHTIEILASCSGCLKEKMFFMQTDISTRKLLTVGRLIRRWWTRNVAVSEAAQ